jgi:hypothetical protein
MDGDLEKAKSYRERAEAARTIAAGTKDGPSREILLNVAMDYERMAKSRDAISASEHARGEFKG